MKVCFLYHSMTALSSLLTPCSASFCVALLHLMTAHSVCVSSVSCSCHHAWDCRVPRLLPHHQPQLHRWDHQRQQRLLPHQPKVRITLSLSLWCWREISLHLPHCMRYIHFDCIQKSYGKHLKYLLCFCWVIDSYTKEIFTLSRTNSFDPKLTQKCIFLRMRLQRPQRDVENRTGGKAVKQVVRNEALTKIR